METNITELENCKKELEATLTYDELKPHFEKHLEKFRKKANIPGFRKGKVPVSMLKKMYGDSLEYQALEDITNDVFKQYVKDNNVDIIDIGAILDMDYKPKESFRFKISYETKPVIKIDEYKGLELNKTIYEIDESLVDEEIDYFKFRNASMEMDGQAKDDQYTITVNLRNLDADGKELEGQSQNGLQVYLGNPDIFPEFKKGFKGIKEGETRIIDSKNAEGEPKKVEITCVKVEKVIFPPMDEEFFKKVLGTDEVKTEADFRKKIREDIQKVYDDMASTKMKNDVVSEMIKVNEVSVPDKYVEYFLDDFVKEEKEKHKGHNHGINEEEIRKSKRGDAILAAKWMLLRDELIKMENIQPADEDYVKMAEETSKRFNIPADSLVNLYKQNEDIKMRIQNDKVLDFLIANAKVTEKTEVKKKQSLNDNMEAAETASEENPKPKKPRKKKE